MSRRVRAIARWTSAVVVVVVLGSCGQGSPGGFRAATRGSPPAEPTTTTTNTIPQGSPAPPPVASPTPGDVKVSVNLAQGKIAPSAKEVNVRKVAFVVSNDDQVERRLRVATVSGTALVGTDLIRPTGVATLSVELAPGLYRLVAEGGGRPEVAVEFTVAGSA